MLLREKLIVSKVSIKGFKYCRCCGEYVFSKNYDPVEQMCYDCSDNEPEEDTSRHEWQQALKFQEREISEDY